MEYYHYKMLNISVTQYTLKLIKIYIKTPVSFRKGVIFRVIWHNIYLFICLFLYSFTLPDLWETK